MVSKKIRKRIKKRIFRDKVKIVLFVFLSLWFLLSVFRMYELSFEVVIAEEKATEIAHQAEKWRSLAYRLNSEIAGKMEKMIQEYSLGGQKMLGKIDI